jgi:DNA-binding NarL/FixJ family response regulator
VAGSKIRVLLVADHQIMREGLRNIIEEQADLEVVAEAADGEMAVEAARQFQPDVVIMDMNMPKMNGLEATRQIKAEFPQITVIGLSMHEIRRWPRRCETPERRTISQRPARLTYSAA